jgi:proline utilization trans-activator
MNHNVTDEGIPLMNSDGSISVHQGQYPSDSTSAESGPQKSNEPAGQITGTKHKRTSLACIRCRSRHIRCPGGEPCKKCQLAKTKCEYVVVDKKIVVSMKYLSKLHDDIARLKKDNAMLRNKLNGGEIPTTFDDTMKEHRQIQAQQTMDLDQTLLMSSTSSFTDNIYTHQQINSDIHSQNIQFSDSTEVIQPSLDKHGRLVESTTGEKVYVGSSSMTLFGLEIQNMVPPVTLLSNSASNSPDDFVTTPKSQISDTLSVHNAKRETEILEKEGNAYKITLEKTNTRPGLSINFTLPSYSYAMLLVDTFINYNDGCFYFFNEGLVKRFLMNLYSGKNKDNKQILRRNLTPQPKDGYEPSLDENSIKKDADDDTILETIWFCKILLVFAIGEMYLGTESDVHIKSRNNLEKSKQSLGKRGKKSKATLGIKHKERRNTLPGSGFFYQASELFTGLFASGAIDNITKDGGIEVMLLYAFYLQVADCTISSYFYFGLALRATLILGWHVDADKENLNRFELEHRRRIWWTVYMYERMLSSKAGLPLSFADDSVSTELPTDFKIDLNDFPRNENDVRGYYIFPNAAYINNCVTITQINAIILSSLYTKQPTVNILPVVSDLVSKLMAWKNSLPKFLSVDFSIQPLRVTRLIVNLMTEYFQGMNLAVRPLLFHFATKKLKELHQQNSVNKYVDLTKFSKNVLSLLNASFQASINTIKSIWALLPENMVALFGWMDREYLFTSASTLILFNASFGVHDATKEHLDHALTVFAKMKKLGNYPAALRRAQLLKLIRVLDFNGVTSELLAKHDDERKEGEIKQEFSDNKMNISNENLNQIDEMRQLDSTGDLDFLQFDSVNSSMTSKLMRNHNHPNTQHVSTQPAEYATSSLNNDTFNFNISVPQENGQGDVYGNSDLAGIEGLTYLDDEQKLWNEITNDAVWLHVAGGNPNQPPGSIEQNDLLKPNDRKFDFGVYNSNDNENYVSMSNGGYSDLVNLEF